MLSGNTEPPAQHVGAIAENSLHIGSHQQGMREPIECYRVLHAIADQRAAVAFYKSVLVNPKPIRAADLLVDEAHRWFPCGNLRTPTHRETVDAQLVLEHRAAMHLNRAGRDGAEIQPRRRNR